MLPSQAWSEGKIPDIEVCVKGSFVCPTFSSMLWSNGELGPY